MLKTIGHHTLENKDENKAYREKIGPVKSSIFEVDGKTIKEKPPFAGDGYYFWDDNIEAARWWGKTNYKKYSIYTLEIIINYNTSEAIDLVGKRSDMALFLSLISELKTTFGRKCDNWHFYNYLLALREKEKETPGIFPFNIIRFNDMRTGKGHRKSLKVAKSKSKPDHFIELSPYYIICIFDIQKHGLKTFRFLE